MPTELTSPRDPVLDDVFLRNFPFYFRTVVRLRRLSMTACRREYEDIRSEGICNYLELRAGEAARELRLRQAVRAISRACYRHVERRQRRRPEPLPTALRAEHGTDPIENAQRAELREHLERLAPGLSTTLLRQDCYLTSGRLSKSAVMRRSGLSRRRIDRLLRRVRFGLRRSLGAE